MHLIRDVGCQNPGHARNASWMLCLLIILVRIAGLCLDNPSFMMMRSLSAVIQSSSGWSLHRTTGPFFPPFLSLPLALPLPLPLASLPWPFSCAPAVLRTEHTLPVTLPGAPALQPWSPQPGSVAVERTRLCVFHRSSSSEEDDDRRALVHRALLLGTNCRLQQRTGATEPEVKLSFSSEECDEATLHSALESSQFPTAVPTAATALTTGLAVNTRTTPLALAFALVLRPGQQKHGNAQCSR